LGQETNSNWGCGVGDPSGNGGAVEGDDWAKLVERGVGSYVDRRRGGSASGVEARKISAGRETLDRELIRAGGEVFHFE
jgi:hypothetical protein